MTELILTPEKDRPARSDSSRAALLLGVKEHDIATLIRARLLKPLGNPESNAPKYFATCEIIRLANDVEWLDRVSRAITQYWKTKNSRRSDRRLTAGN